MRRATQRPTQRRGASFRAALAFSICIAVCIAPGRVAHAGASLQATITASAGVTDNVASVATKPVAGTEGRQSDFELILAPGLFLAGGTPRAVQTVAYTFAGIVYGRHSEADTYTNSLLYSGLYLPSKRSRVGLNFGLTQGQLSAFNIAVPSNGQQSQAQVNGQQDVLTVSANQSFAYELAPDWLFSQTLGYSTTYNLSPPPAGGIAQSAPGSLRIERAFRHSAIALEGDVTFTDYYAQRGPVTLPDGSVDKNGVIVPEQLQFIVTPQAQYRRDLTYWLSARVNLGATVVVDPRDASNHYVAPIGGVGLNFNTPRTNFDLSYQHSIAPNLLFRSNFVTDSATARGLFLVSRRYNITFALAASYLYSRELDLTNQPEGHAHTVLIDATLAYQPLRELSFFLRYQLIDQIAGNGGGAADVPNNVFTLATYYRNTLLFGLTATYPAEAAVQVRGNTIGVRADHSDDARIDVSKSATP